MVLYCVFCSIFSGESGMHDSTTMNEEPLLSLHNNNQHTAANLEEADIIKIA